MGNIPKECDNKISRFGRERGIYSKKKNKMIICYTFLFN